MRMIAGRTIDGACRARHVGEPGGGGGRGGAALVDVGRRGLGAQRAEGGPRGPGHRLAGHAGRRRRRHPGDDGAARAGHLGQPADGGADARLRHPRLGEGRRRSPTSTTSPPRRAGTRWCPRRCSSSPSLRRPMGRGAGQRALDQLGLGQQGGARRARHRPADRPGTSSIAALDKVKAAGKVALAHGGQPWQDATLFDAVLMSTGGPEFYKATMIDLDTEAARLGAR